MKLPLKLKRPLAIIDLETTGLIAGLDRVIEIAVLKIHPNGRRTRYCSRVNPEMRIPPEASKIHGIRDGDVRTKPTFEKIVPKLTRLLQSCDLAGFNILRFDLPMLREEFRRIGKEFPWELRKIIDACRIFHINEPRDLTAAYRYYCDGEHAEAHSALEDTRACWEVLCGQLSRYRHLPRSVGSLDRYCNPTDERYVDASGKFEWRYGEAVFLFGKNKGRTLGKVAEESPDDLRWMLREDFSPEVKKIARNALRGKYPRRTATAKQERTT
jgi:DNA polymerase III subunit epsilon